MWVSYQLCRAYYSRKRLRLRLWLPQKIAALVIVLLGASTAVSLAPEATAFKVYQILVAFLFTLIFAEWYGVETCLNRMLLGSSLLCAVLAVSAFVAPDLVLATSETGFARLRGQGITEAGFAATFALVLLLTTRRRLSQPVFISLGVCFSTILFLSLARVGWLALGVFFALALRLLALLVEDYDRRHALPPDKSTPAEKLQFLLEHSGKTVTDLQSVFGQRSHVNEALTGKRSISAPQARKLGRRFRVSPGLFL